MSNGEDFVKRAKQLQKIEKVKDKYLTKLSESGATDDQMKRANQMFQNKRKEIMDFYKSGTGETQMERLNRGKSVRVGGSVDADDLLMQDPKIVSRLRGDLAKSAAKQGRENIFKKFMKGASKGMKMIPGIGTLLGIGAGMMTGQDAGAATVDTIVPGGVEGTGPRPGSMGAIVEDSTMTPEQKQRAIELMQQRLRGE